eukprot:13760709-Alexandrium_andersonii.AAC.1
MSASLVGSEMCIRDSATTKVTLCQSDRASNRPSTTDAGLWQSRQGGVCCRTAVNGHRAHTSRNTAPTRLTTNNTMQARAGSASAALASRAHGGSGGEASPS